MSRQQINEGKRVLRLKEVCGRTGISRAGVYDRTNPNSKYFDPRFPRSFKLGMRSVGWDSEEVDAWIALMKEGE